MSDREWLVPSVALTLLLALSGFFLIPDFTSVIGALTLLPLWILSFVVAGGIYGLPALREMHRRGVKSPTVEIARLAVRHWRPVLFVFCAMILAGLNMIAFMWTKPLLNHLVPFWADPMLADADWYLFLGNDPARLLDWLNSMPAAIFYHRAWFALMVLTLLLVLTQRPSAEKSALMLTYFLLWSVVGPVIHLAMPAAGPVFYQDLGYGDRFAFIHVPHEVGRMADYLWYAFSNGKFLPGAGISAMPSLHVATTAWMLIAVFVLARRWFVAMAVLGSAIFILSISLGWHYAVDGLVGGAAAAACYLLAKAGYSRRARSEPEPALVPAALR